MAIRYIDNRATGAGNGTSAADAYTTIAAASVSAGDTIIFVAGSGPYREDFNLHGNGSAASPIKWIGNGCEISAGRDMNVGTYKWTASATANEYILQTAAGGNPSLTQVISGVVAGRYWGSSAEASHTSGTPGSLSLDYQIGWGDADTLGYSTLYVRMPTGVHPSTVKIIVAQANYALNTNWGHHEFHGLRITHGNVGVIQAQGLNWKFFGCVFMYSDYSGFRTGANGGLGTENKYEFHSCITYWTGHRAYMMSHVYAQMKIYNCVDWGSHLMVWAANAGVDATSVIDFQNCISANGEAGAVDMRSATCTFTENNNCFYDRMTNGGAVGYVSTANWPTTAATDLPPSIATTESDQANLVDPLFVATSDLDFDLCDFNLQSTSPCLGAGINAGSYGTQSYGTGEPVPGFGIDMGAIQSTYGPFHPLNLNG